MSKTIATPQKSHHPFKSSLITLVAVGFLSGFCTLGAFWLLDTGLGLASYMFSIVLMFISLTLLIVALRVYASISLTLAQNDQKHIQNAIIQAKDMLDSSKQLRDEHVLVQSLTQNIPFPMWLKDRFGRYLVCNQAFVKQWCNGIDPIGKTDAELLNKQLVDAFTTADLAALNTSVPQKLDLKLEITNSIPKWVRIERYALVGDNKEAVGVLGFAFDISDYKSDVAIERDLHTDPLTHFSNELGLRKFLAQNTQPKKGDTWCFHVDIDHFNLLNESKGTESADRLLQQIAQRLNKAANTGDFLVRKSTSEFVVFWFDNNDNRGQRLSELHQKLCMPVTIADIPYNFTASIGVAHSPEHGTTLGELNQNANVALFNAKKLGRNQIHHYHSDYDDQASRRLDKDQMLHSAINNQNFLVHIQPRINCLNGEIESLECLVRLELEDNQIVYPGSFIELAEQNGLIREIDKFMLDKVLTSIKNWLDEGVVPLPLSVNLSTQSVNSNLVDILSKWQNIDPNVFAFLEIELTEHSLPENDAEFLSILHQIRAFGICLALDDFGTGYANLSRLPEWPFQILKLDRSFIVDIPNSEKQQAVVRSVVELCKTLEIKVVAEGVETEEELILIDQLGCHSIQGFVYARPKPLEDIGIWLTLKKIQAQ